MRLRAVLSVATAALALTACGSNSTTAKEPSPLAQWNSAYAFLSAQTKPTEIVCNWFTNSNGTPRPAARPAAFYNFADTAAWKTHVITRNDTLPSGLFEACLANVPTSVPYGPGIETFLKKHGLVFGTTAPGLTPIDIAYAGQNANDPDIIYRDKPGLFGLEGALHQLGKSPFVAGTSKIIQPTSNDLATQYLTYARPLLEWYGYSK